MTCTKEIKLLICDLDNTLYDWVDYFVCAFYDMVDEATRIIGCDKEQLLDDLRKVHVLNQDSEHPFALLETDVVAAKFPNLSRSERAKALDSAFYVFNSSRKKNLKLYPGVQESLNRFSESGIRIVAHTESKLYGAMDRLDRLDIIKYFSRVYCRERPKSSHPDRSRGQGWLDRLPLEKVVELSNCQRKPDERVLREICKNEGACTSESAYVGDSIARDIMMARNAGVFSIWAKYGAQPSIAQYEKLVRVSHWSEKDIVREKELRALAVTVSPDIVLQKSFSELDHVLQPNAVILS